MSESGRGRGSQGKGAIVPHPSNPSNSTRGAIIHHPTVPIPAVDVVNQYQVLGQIPRPFNSVLASKPKSNDPFAICSPEPQPIKLGHQKFKKSASEYIPKYQVNLFFVESHMEDKDDPIKLAIQYFPPGWHFLPLAPFKSLSYYKDILIQTESIFIKPIYDREDETRVIYHALYIKQFIPMSYWGKHPSDLHLLQNQGNHFCYHDYMEAWMKIFLYQNQSFSHSWFIQFDHKFKSKIPFWFIIWWERFGPTMSLFPEKLQSQVNHFSKSKYNPRYEGIPLLLAFTSKYKIPWILKWQYNLENPIIESAIQTSGPSQALVNQYSYNQMVARLFFIKWWDKFDVDRIVGQVQKEFPNIPNFAPPVSQLTVPHPKSVKEKGSTSETKSTKSKSSPTGSIDTSDIKKCSKSELKLLAQALSKRVTELYEEDEEEDNSSKSSQGSINSKDPYNSQLFQDTQDPFA